MGGCREAFRDDGSAKVFSVAIILCMYSPGTKSLTNALSSTVRYLSLVRCSIKCLIVPVEAWKISMEAWIISVEAWIASMGGRIARRKIK